MDQQARDAAIERVYQKMAEHQPLKKPPFPRERWQSIEKKYIKRLFVSSICVFCILNFGILMPFLRAHNASLVQSFMISLAIGGFIALITIFLHATLLEGRFKQFGVWIIRKAAKIAGRSIIVTPFQAESANEKAKNSERIKEIIIHWLSINPVLSEREYLALEWGDEQIRAIARAYRCSDLSCQEALDVQRILNEDLGLVDLARSIKSSRDLQISTAEASNSGGVGRRL